MISWLASDCCGKQQACSSKGVIKLDTQIAVGGRNTHPTHHICIFRGVIFCTRCGGIGVVKITSLHEQCMPGALNSHRKQNLDRLARGLLPKGVTRWPQEDVNRPLEGAGLANLSDEDDEDLDAVAESVAVQVAQMAAQEFPEQIP